MGADDPDHGVGASVVVARPAWPAKGTFGISLAQALSIMRNAPLVVPVREPPAWPHVRPRVVARMWCLHVRGGKESMAILATIARIALRALCRQFSALSRERVIVRSRLVASMFS